MCLYVCLNSESCKHWNLGEQIVCMEKTKKGSEDIQVSI